MLAERFLQAFHRIEGFLREMNRGDHAGFADLVRRTARLNRAVSANESKLLQYGRLRNAIVHEQVKPDFVIAIPHAEVVESIEKIDLLIRNPPRVDAQFGREVKCLQADDPIIRALSLMKQHHLSQFPVYQQRSFKGLLGARCVAQWLAGAIPDEGVLFDGRVGDVLAHDETGGKNLEFLARNKTLYDAQYLFATAPQRGIPVLEAILITERGRSDESLLGIITPWDILGTADTGK